MFLRFAADIAPKAEALFILGDLFEYWAGDDDLNDPFHQRITDTLRELDAHGTRIFIMHGNRDFLMDEELGRACNATLLDDPTLIDLYGTPTLLTHGDALCTDDTEYQRFRELVRNDDWQTRFLAQPLAQRKAQIEQMRMQSETQKSSKEMDIDGCEPGRRWMNCYASTATRASSTATRTARQNICIIRTDTPASAGYWETGTAARQPSCAAMRMVLRGCIYNSTSLQESIQQFSAVVIHGTDIPDQERHAISVGDQQRCICEAADMVFRLEQQFGIAAIGRYLPLARRGETGDLPDAGDFRHELALCQFGFDQQARLLPADRLICLSIAVRARLRRAMTRPASGALMGKARTGTTPS